MPLPYKEEARIKRILVIKMIRLGMSFRDIIFKIKEYPEFTSGVGSTLITKIRKGLAEGSIESPSDLSLNFPGSQNDLSDSSEVEEIKALLKGFYDLFEKNSDNLSEITEDEIELAEKAEKVFGL